MRDRVIILDRPEYTVSYHIEETNEGQQMTFVHLDVFYISPSIMREMLRLWPVIQKHMNCVTFCLGEVDDEKFDKFVSRFGWRYLRPIPCTDGRTRRLYINFGPTKEAQEQ